jgi:hypothetical protein
MRAGFRLISERMVATLSGATTVDDLEVAKKDSVAKFVSEYLSANGCPTSSQAERDYRLGFARL